MRQSAHTPDEHMTYSDGCELSPLHAAAPALLKALSNLVANEHGAESVKAICYREARAAIAQAKGETA